MRCLGSILLGLLVGAPLGAIQAAVPGSPDRIYAVIAERNVFGLKPILPQPQALPPQPPLPKILLTGITTILGSKQVLLKVQMPARPPEPASESSLILTEGQRDGMVEVLEIDVGEGRVRLINSGTEMKLSIEKDGPILASAPVPAVATPPGSRNVLPPGTRPIGLDPNVARRGMVGRNPRGISVPSTAASEAPPLPAPPVSNVGQEQPSSGEQAILTELEREANQNQK